jgi:metal-dependent amidase/aminoacylase/carboxypeptidase family protein
MQVIIGQAAVHRCNATVDFLHGVKPFYPPTVNNGDLHEHFVNVAVNMLGINNVDSVMTPFMGSEDFSFYQEVIPGYFFMLGVKNASHKRFESLLHSPYLEINEDGLPYGAALHASLAASYLLKHQQDIVPGVERKYHDEL